MPKTVNEQKRAPLSLRTTDDVRRKLEESARASGRSLAAEVEFIVQQHFDQPALIDALADRLAARIADQAEQAHLVRVLDSLEPTTGYFL